MKINKIILTILVICALNSSQCNSITAKQIVAGAIMCLTGYEACDQSKEAYIFRKNTELFRIKLRRGITAGLSCALTFYCIKYHPSIFKS